MRVCQAKRVAPPIVPESATTATSSSTSLSSQQHQSHHQQQHRHSGSSFDSGGSAESSSGGYCSGTGSLSSCHAPSSSAWSQTGSDQRSSIGLDDAFLPPPPSSPAAHVNNNSGNKHHHMYSRGTYTTTPPARFFSFSYSTSFFFHNLLLGGISVTVPKSHASLRILLLLVPFAYATHVLPPPTRMTIHREEQQQKKKTSKNLWTFLVFSFEKRNANRPQHSYTIRFLEFVLLFHIQMYCVSLPVSFYVLCVCLYKFLSCRP